MAASQWFLTDFCGLNMIRWLPACATLPTQQKPTLLLGVPPHTDPECEICEISGQLPTQLYKEFPRIPNVRHSKKAMLRIICQASIGACLEHPLLNPVGRASLTSSSPSCEAKSEQLCTSLKHIETLHRV